MHKIGNYKEAIIIFFPLSELMRSQLFCEDISRKDYAEWHTPNRDLLSDIIVLINLCQTLYITKDYFVKLSLQTGPVKGCHRQCSRSRKAGTAGKDGAQNGGVQGTRTEGNT